jgi:transcriptional regulator with XRE-family HTH domain
VSPNRTLKALRIFKGLEQAQVARAARISQQAYSRIETGRQSPDLKVAARIARVLEVDPDLIFAEMEVH